MLLLSQTCTIYRNTQVATNGRTEMTELSANVPCLTITMNTSTTIQNGFELGRAYDIYFNIGTDVKSGDKIVCGDDSYIVTRVEIFNQPMVEHVHVLAQQQVGT